MSVTLTQPVPAFRIDDGTLERLWWTLEEKCAEAKPSTSSLTVRDRIRVAGRRTPEVHRQEYQSTDALRRASSGPNLLRDYTLTVSSPWGDNRRSVRLEAFGGGRAASLEVTAPEAEWCHEVVDAVLEQLRPYRAWYALAHRGGFGPTFVAVVAVVAVVAILLLQQVWATVAALACQFSLTALILSRDRLLPAADICVERGAPSSRSRERLGDDSYRGPTEDRDSRESAARARREPAPRDGEGIASLSDYRRRSEQDDTTVH